MRLQRIYDQSKLVRDKAGRVVDVLRDAVIGVKVERSGGIVKHFTPKFVIGGQREGWLKIIRESLVIDNIGGEDLKFKIIRYPGHYCDHCEVKIESGNSFVPDPRDSDRSVTAAYAHVLTEHAGLRCVDNKNPLGIRKEEFYTCVRGDGDLVKIEKSIRLDKAKVRKVKDNG